MSIMACCKLLRFSMPVSCPLAMIIPIKLQTKSKTQCQSVQITVFLAFSFPQKRLYQPGVSPSLTFLFFTERDLCRRETAFSDLSLICFYWYLFQYIEMELSHQTSWPLQMELIIICDKINCFDIILLRFSFHQFFHFR